MTGQRGDLQLVLPASLRPPELDRLADSLVAYAREQQVPLTGPGSLTTDFVRRLLEAGLEAEMAEHLGYERGESGDGANERNGTSEKTVTTELGKIRIRIPRDRNSEFKPVTVPKHVRRMDGFDGMVLSLYAKGMTTIDIQRHLEQIYGTAISAETISTITDGIVEDLTAWQNRPLDAVYPVILIDAIYLKIRDSVVGNRPVYVVLGINMEGEREVLGLWVSPTSGEGAKYWLGILTELRNRGVKDVFVICSDGLKGLDQSIDAAFPSAEHQTCVVHLVRNSLRYVSKRHWGKVTKDMRAIYTAPTVEAAEARLEEFKRDWATTSPAMIRVWEDAWPEFIPFLSFPVEIRKLIYTTNAIESLNSRFRRATRVRGHFPNEQAALKVMYLTIMDRIPNRTNANGRIAGWKSILNTLTIHYADRLANQPTTQIN